MPDEQPNETPNPSIIYLYVRKIGEFRDGITNKKCVITKLTSNIPRKRKRFQITVINQ